MRVLRWLGGGILVLTLVAVAAGGGLFLYLRTSLPQTRGEVSLPGLKSEARIARDDNGIAHIKAKSAEDAFFALGYAHAQDRLWQMETNRRITAGRLAEVVGAKGLDVDRFLRGIGLRRAAEAALAAFSAEERLIVSAYARGVNAFISNPGGALPPEFLIFRYRPEPWTEADSVAMAGLMSLDLSGNWQAELNRMRLLAKLTPQQVQELYPPYPGDAPVPLPDLRALYASVTEEIDVKRLAEVSPPEKVDGIGSNNWVISGAHSKSGKPMLANDPHLAMTTPSIWYLAHITAPGMDVTGTTLPGAPGVILGRNDRIAWGFTNTGPDTQDLYIERVDPSDPNRYITPDGSEAFTVRREVFKVRDGADLVLDIRSTRHGPVLSDISDTYARTMKPGHVLALAWTSLMPGDRTASVAPRLMTARNWEEFRNILRDFHGPQQNMIYADVDGNIGFIAPARIPVRAKENDAHGLVPVPGWERRYDWQGFLPFEDLPQVFNPPSGSVVTANHKIVPPEYPHFLTVDWSDSARARRITEMLAAEQKHDADSFARIQTDVQSGIARDLIPHFKRLHANPATDPKVERARQLLLGWDLVSAPEREEPLLFHAWYRRLTRLLVEDELGDLYAPVFRNARPGFVANVLSDTGGQSRWCDDVRTSAPESCAEMVSRALELAHGDIESSLGPDTKNHLWGRMHYLAAQHRPLSNVRQLQGFLEKQVPTPGDSYTVNVGRHDITNDKAPFANVHAAGYRGIFDLSDLASSRFIQSTGQSGNPLSQHFHRFIVDWAQGRYFHIGDGNGLAATLTLKPAGNF